MKGSAIEHHGIKGMRWGVRRYQNEDGTLTSAGKKRYSEKDGKDSSIFDKTIKVGKDKSPISPAEKISKESLAIIDEASKLTNNIRKVTKKSSSNHELSNEELRQMIERMRLEDAYEELSQKRVDRGKKSVNDILAIAGSVAAIASSAVGIAATVKNLRK